MDTTRRAWLVKAAGIAGSSMAGANFARAAAPGARKVVLGQSVPLTGAASEIGLAFAAGAKLYVDAFNAKPDGPWQLELRQLDDGYDAARATANAKKLAADGADLFVLGFVGTASSSAGAAVAKQEGLVFLAPFAAADSLRDGSNPQVFHVRPSMADEAFKMVQQSATIGRTSARQHAAGGRRRHGPRRPRRGRAGDARAQDAAARGQRLRADQQRQGGCGRGLHRRAQRPQVVIQVSLFNSTAAFIRKMKKAGYGGTFMNFSVVGIDPLFVALGKDIKGVVITQVVPSPRSSGIPIVREYLTAIDNSRPGSELRKPGRLHCRKSPGRSGARKAGPGPIRTTLPRALAAS